MIEEPGELIAGMNVNAEIMVEEAKNVLLVPVSAVSGIKNGQGTVMVKNTADTDGNTDKPVRGDGFAGDKPAQAQQRPNTPDMSKKPANAVSNYVPKKVEIGIANNDYIEIVSGLNEGDEVFYVGASNNNRNFFGGGGMPMGGSNMHVQPGRSGR
jgi:HlyD family secretion protein